MIARGLPLALLLAACSPPPADEIGWPAWRGPEMNGTHPATGVFPDTGFDLVLDWERKIGPGYSGVGVAAGRAVTMYSDGVVDRVVALDATSGEPRWEYELGPTRKGGGGANDGPLGSPALHDDVVLVVGPRGNLVALDPAEGSELWSVDLVAELGARAPPHGFATTPLVTEHGVLVAAGGEANRATCALDFRDGRLLWSRGDDPVGYQSPILLDPPHTVLAITSRGVTAVDARDGSRGWTHPHLRETADGVAQVVPIEGDRLFVHYLAGSLLYRLDRTGGQTRLEEVWRSVELKSNLCPPVYLDGFLYGFRQGSLLCVDASSGEIAWESDAVSGRGIILVDGHLVVLGSEGELVVARASSAGYDEKIRLETPIRDSYTFPSFAGGRIFLRDLERIVAIRIDS